MRRILRKISSNEIEAIGDTTTLAEPAIVQHIIDKGNNNKNNTNNNNVKIQIIIIMMIVIGCKAELNGNGDIRVSR